MTSSKQNSRFSTLKVFKFAGSKSEGSSKPPPPPPKDRYYLYNRSLASLSPDSLSLPTTPLSPDYGQRTSPGPSHSTMSLVSSGASISPSAADAPRPSIAPKRSFFKLGSLGKRGKSSPLESEVVQSPDDENISLPWNFQHNIHVDEGYSGIPPSWSASLADAGFSEDEIAAIHARRGTTRSPSSSYVYADRPQSPAPAVLANPHPRTSSLPRQFSDASLASSYRQPSQRVPPVPLPIVPPMRKFSSSSSSSSSSSRNGSSNTESQYVYVNRPAPGTFLPSESSCPPTEPSERSSSPSNNSSSAQSEPQVRPRTPPRRQFRVINESPDTMASPPPAYRSPVRPTAFPQGKTSEPDPPPPSEDNVMQQDEDESAVRDSRRLTALPPRLSLHEDSDLSNWSESLFSAIPSGTFNSNNPRPLLTPSSAPSHPPSSFSLDTPTLSSSSSSSSSSKASVPRRYPPQKPIPAIPTVPAINVGQTSEVGGTYPPTTPLWKEILGMVQVSASAPSVTSSPLSPETPFTPALSESGSPTLPVSAGPGLLSPQLKSSDLGEEGLTLFPPGTMKERESNRDSGMSTVSTATVTAATIVRDASIATRAKANVIEPSPSKARPTINGHLETDEDAPTSLKSTESTPRHSPKYQRPVANSVTPRAPSPTPASSSPHSSYFSDSGSSEESRSGSGSFYSRSRGHDSQSPMSEVEVPPKSPRLAYLDASPDPSKTTFGRSASPTPLSPRDATFVPSIKGEADALRRPSIVITAAELGGSDQKPTSVVTSSASSPSTGSPATPAQKYRGWQSEVVAPLEEFINDSVDPRAHYVDLMEIAEGESGSVYAAHVVSPKRLQLPSAAASADASVVAIKSVAILPSGSPKLDDLRRELTLMRGVRHVNVLSMDALYVDLVEDSLWIRMELMERSLADVVTLVTEGLMVQERMIARFASDVLLALEYLQEHNIAHRDVRSDNLLLNSAGVLKIADFSSAVQVTPQSPMCSGPTGVIYWQAPEMRSGPYNALKVDAWSLGATVWEMAQAEPPFADVQDPRQIRDRWPPLTHPELYSRSFHDFLRLCSQPSSSRPDPSKLSNTPFIRNACGRVVIIQLLTQCKTIEERMAKRNSVESQGAIYSP